MSQEKVDKYKEQKTRRKEIIKKQRRMHLLRTAAVSLLAVILVGWLGYSAFDMYRSNQPRSMVEVDYTALDAYAQGLTATE